MAKRSRKLSASKIEWKIKEGDGQGRGTDYKPWCVIQDVPSLGLVTRIKGWKTGRVHHLLSQLEMHYFYLLEWSSSVQDIREQYPLQPLDEPIAIAQGIGIKHPMHPHTVKIGSKTPQNNRNENSPAQTFYGERYLLRVVGAMA